MQRFLVHLAFLLALTSVSVTDASSTPSPPSLTSSSSTTSRPTKINRSQAIPAHPQGVEGGAARAPFRTGPIPDFGPHRGVATHVLLDDMDTDLGRRLSRRFGRGHIVEDYSPSPDDPRFEEAGTLLWMRDFVPIFVRTADGGVVALRYLSENHTRRTFYLSDDESILLPSSDDDELGVWMPVKTIPIIHENGNLVSTGKYVFMADSVVADNRETRDSPELKEAGYRPRDPHELISLLSTYLERPKENIIILPRLPGERTGHVDIFLLALDEKSVMIPEVRAEAIAVVETEEEYLHALEVRDFLDEQARILAALGIRVERLPMIAPRLLPSVSDEDGEELDMVVFTPANSLLVRSRASATAFLPRFSHSEDLPWSQRRLQRRYEHDWSRFFRREGWRVDSAEASELARYLGVFRCVTAPMPELPL